MRINFVSQKTGHTLGYVELSDGKVSSDKFGKEFLAGPQFEGMDEGQAFEKLATGWSNGYMATEVVE